MNAAPRPLRSRFFGALLGATILVAPAVAQVQFPAASPAAVLKEQVGLTTITIAYSRPSARGRTMLGGILPYGQVWRTGANSATKITFSTDVRLNGAAVPAGTYSLFTIPGPKSWTVIINRQAKQWGAFDYDAGKDLVRFSADASEFPGFKETFTIEFDDLRDDSATLFLVWEKTKVAFKVDVATTPKVLSEIQAALASPEPKKYGFYFQAATFYFEHGQDLDQCLKLVDAMLAQHPPIAFEGEFLKAKILQKKGDRDGALAAAHAAAAGAAQFKEDSIRRQAEAIIASLKS